MGVPGGDAERGNPNPTPFHFLLISSAARALLGWGLGAPVSQLSPALTFLASLRIGPVSPEAGNSHALK